MSTDTKRHLSTINETLRAEYTNLKFAKDDLIEHISMLIKREKQLSSIKEQLSLELTKVKEIAKSERLAKASICLLLKEELKEYDKKILDENAQLKNL